MVITPLVSKSLIVEAVRAAESEHLRLEITHELSHTNYAESSASRLRISRQKRIVNVLKHLSDLTDEERALYCGSKHVNLPHVEKALKAINER